MTRPSDTTSLFPSISGCDFDLPYAGCETVKTESGTKVQANSPCSFDFPAVTTLPSLNTST